ncbi:hypothetical protein J6590_043898 [Homalodisca vitripennis]|nr:hypothetical protein J6590_043898 [Homalodisca vitripennis]
MISVASYVVIMQIMKVVRDDLSDNLSLLDARAIYEEKFHRQFPQLSWCVLDSAAYLRTFDEFVTVASVARNINQWQEPKVDRL